MKKFIIGLILLLFLFLAISTVYAQEFDPWIGTEDPQVIIVEFADYACPYCAKFANEVEGELIKN